MKDELNKDSVNSQAAPNLSSFLSFDELMHEYESHRAKPKEASIELQEASVQPQPTFEQETVASVQVQEPTKPETNTYVPQEPPLRQPEVAEQEKAPVQQPEAPIQEEPHVKRERIHFKHEARAYIPVNPEEEFVTVVYEEGLPQQTENEAEPQPEQTVQQQSDETAEPQQPARTSKLHDYFRRRKKTSEVGAASDEPPSDEPTEVEPLSEEPTKTQAPPDIATEFEVPQVEPPDVIAPPEEPIDVETLSQELTDNEVPTVEPTELEALPEEPTEVETPTVEPTELESPPEEPTEVETLTGEPTELESPPEEPTEVETPTGEPTEVESPPEEPTEVEPPTVESAELEAPPEEFIEVDSPSVKATAVEAAIEGTQELETAPAEPADVEAPPKKPKKTKAPRKKNKKSEPAKVAPTVVIIPREEPADETLSYGNETAVEQLKQQAKANRYTHSIPLAQRESRREMTVPVSLKGLVTVVIFLALIEAVFAANIILPDKQYSQTEKRSLTQLPEFSFAAIKSGSYMERFESYISDQFLFRDDIVSLKATAERILGKKEQNNIYLGKNGWLFEKQSEYSAKNAGKLTSAINVFCKRNSSMKSAVLIAPNSSYIMGNMLPAFVEPDNQNEQLESIYKLINDEVDKINVVKIFEESKEKYQLYYKTDHHWTTRAARIAFLELANTWKLDTKAIKYEYHTVSTDFSGTLADSSGIYETADSIEICMPENSTGTYVVKNSDLQTKSTTLFDISKLEMQNKYEVFCGGNNSMLTISTTNRNAKKLLIFKDSYANCMIPMFTPYFQEIVVIDPRYFTQDLNDILKNESFTHVLFLYNMNTFLEDNSLVDVISSKN